MGAMKKVVLSGFDFSVAREAGCGKMANAAPEDKLRMNVA
jgi:hypothetical protein